MPLTVQGSPCCYPPRAPSHITFFPSSYFFSYHLLSFFLSHSYFSSTFVPFFWQKFCKASLMIALKQKSVFRNTVQSMLLAGRVGLDAGTGIWILATWGPPPPPQLATPNRYYILILHKYCTYNVHKYCTNTSTSCPIGYSKPILH